MKTPLPPGPAREERLASALRSNLRRRKAAARAGTPARTGTPERTEAPAYSAASHPAIHIEGGRRLCGEIRVSGAKNAALPLMIASLLTGEALALENVPALADTAILRRVLEELGVEIAPGAQAGAWRLQARRLDSTCAPYELVSRMRASFWVIGPLLARAGRARVSLPGGDAIGARPVDFTLEGLRALGARIDLAGGYVEAAAPEGLRGAQIALPGPSIGATHTLLMAAALARGETRIDNAAREPEIASLIGLLQAMGARIEGAGTGRLRIEGAPGLRGGRARVPPDRIEAGTYALAAAAAGGHLRLAEAPIDQMGALLEALERAGVMIGLPAPGTSGVLSIRRDPARTLAPVDMTTAPYPGFPTDLQAQFMALMTCAQGVSRITETIFENRFQHAGELARLGARIGLCGRRAEVSGPARLTGARVMATDLRASASLVIAGLAAQGETIIERVYHLDRGFEKIESKLSACGARIYRAGA